MCASVCVRGDVLCSLRLLSRLILGVHGWLLIHRFGAAGHVLSAGSCHEHPTLPPGWGTVWQHLPGSNPLPAWLACSAEECWWGVLGQDSRVHFSCTRSCKAPGSRAACVLSHFSSSECKGLGKRV